jgi:hypothetical protein
MNPGDAVGGSEFHDQPGISAARQQIEQAPHVRRDRHVHVPHQLGTLLAAWRLTEPRHRVAGALESGGIVLVRRGKQMVEQLGYGRGS